MNPLTYDPSPRPVLQPVTEIFAVLLFQGSGEEEAVACQSIPAESPLPAEFGTLPRDQPLFSTLLYTGGSLGVASIVRTARVLSAASRKRLFLARFHGREDLEAVPEIDPEFRPGRIDRLYSLLLQPDGGRESVPAAAYPARGIRILTGCIAAEPRRLRALEEPLKGQLAQFRAERGRVVHAVFRERETLQVIDERRRRR